MAYSPVQEQKIRQSAPINKEIAEKLASEFGVTVRSVISKTINMGVAYVKEERTKSAPRVRKADLVSDIEKALGIKANSLVNATTADLQKLLQAIS